MVRMPLSHLYFTLLTLSMQVLVLPQWTEGLSCFSCNSKIDAGCKNEDLKSGYQNNMFSEECPGKDAVCVKQSIVVKDYYEEHYSKVEMKKYYTAMDAAAKCRGIGVPPSSDVASAHEGEGVGSPLGETMTADSGDGDSTTDEAEEAGTAPEAQTDAATEATANGGRRRRTVAESCPAYPTSHPEHEALVQRSDKRWLYSCGNASAWRSVGVVSCHTTSDGILARTVCVCGEDLCNGASVQGAGPFLVLGAALWHLQYVIG